MTQRIAFFPADRHSLYEEHGYSAAIRSGDLLFISGQVGSHTDGTPEPDFQNKGYYPNPLMLILGKTGSIVPVLFYSSLPFILYD